MYFWNDNYLFLQLWSSECILCPGVIFGEGGKERKGKVARKEGRKIWGEGRKEEGKVKWRRRKERQNPSETICS